MRKVSWKSNPVLKAILVLLTVVFWTVGFVGLFGAVYLEQAGIYDAVDEDFARQVLNGRIAEQYSIIAVTENHYGEENLSNTNFRYGVIKGFTLDEAVEKGLIDDPKAYAYTNFENGIPAEGKRSVHSYTYKENATEVYVPYNLVNDGYFYNYEYEMYSEDDTATEASNGYEDYIVVGTVADKTYDYSLNDLYNEANTLLMYAYSWNMKSLFPAMAMIGVILALVVTAILCVMAGWRREQNESGELTERLILRKRDYFPLDLGLLCALLLAGTIFGIATESFFTGYRWIDRIIRMNYLTLYPAVTLYACAWLIFLAALMSLFANIKFGGAGKRTLIYRFFHWIGVSLSRLVRFIQGKYLPKYYREMLDEAVEARLKSERFQTELITNVSHDIKTPLTSIINYIDLLSKEELGSEKAREYVTVLTRQSERLKKLIQDLIDASKASSGNVKLEIEEVNLGLLLTQMVGEYEEKMKAADLTLVVTKPEETVHVHADSRNLSRVLDNLMGNIVKYAQKGTRAYIDLNKKADGAELVFRNISAARLNISSEELMRRFVQGDESRKSEGSGLGLSIAESLTKLMGGALALTVDGDLFKVVLTLPE